MTTEQGRDRSEKDRYQEDEFSLFDLSRILFRRKWLVGGIWGLTLLVAIGYLIMTDPDPVYQSQAVIQIGFVDPRGKLEDPNELSQRLGRELPRINASINNDIITLTVQDRTKAGAKQYLERAVNQILSEHQIKFNIKFSDSMEGQRKSHDSLIQLIKELKNQYMTISKMVEPAKKTSPYEAASIVVEKGRLLQRIHDREKEARRLEIAINESLSRQTILLGGPTISDNTIKPNRKVVMALGFTLGLALGIFGAFFAEFFAKTREQWTANE